MVWLALPGLGIRLNLSRQHEWGEESQVYPIYLSAYRLDREEGIDTIPEEIADRVLRVHGCPVKVFAGSHNVDQPDGAPVCVLERDT